MRSATCTDPGEQLFEPRHLLHLGGFAFLLLGCFLSHGNKPGLHLRLIYPGYDQVCFPSGQQSFLSRTGFDCKFLESIQLFLSSLPIGFH